jgi:hypothetical protein
MRRVLIAVLLLLPAGLRAQPAGERILSFRSELRVASDGSVVVRENIVVNAAGNRIRHGIYRDFPTVYRDRLGNRVTVDFDVLAVERDGYLESWRSEPQSNGMRLYFGDKNTFVPAASTNMFSLTARGGSSGSSPITTNSTGTSPAMAGSFPSTPPPLP